jgi:AAA15 family ATPase/GTPase
MYITGISIRNFRALEAFSSPIQKLTVLIGENDVGKTSVLQALVTYFANKKISNAKDFFRTETNRDIEIQVTLAQVPQELIEAHGNRDGTVSIKRVFKFERDPQSYYVKDGQSTEIPKAEAKDLFPRELFHFVPVRRSLDEQFSMGARALLGITLRALMREKLAEPGNVETQERLEEILKSSIEPAKIELQRLMKDQLNDTSIQLNFDNLTIDPLSGVAFDVTVDDSKMPGIPLEQRGAGTQNSMILALYRFVASNIKQNFILALEEPENSFHPKGQRELLSALHRLSRSAQVICTTHSPVFIDRMDFRNNVILVRQPSGATVAKSLDMTQFAEVRAILGIRPSDALLKGGGNCAIIAEGASEEAAIPAFMRLCGIDDRQLGVSVLPLDRCDRDRVHAYVRLLNSYSLPCVVLLDGGIPDEDHLKREFARGHLPMWKELFVLQKGSLEDYYPLDILAEAIELALGGAYKPTEEELFPDLSGGERLKRIVSGLFARDYHIGGVPFLKKQLADTVPAIMSERGIAPDQELRSILERVKDIAMNPERVSQI